MRRAQRKIDKLLAMLEERGQVQGLTVAESNELNKVLAGPPVACDSDARIVAKLASFQDGRAFLESVRAQRGRHATLTLLNRNVKHGCGELFVHCGHPQDQGYMHYKAYNERAAIDLLRIVAMLNIGERTS